MHIQVPVAAALVLGIAASVMDVRTRRVPNVLTLGGTAAALGFHLVTQGPSMLAWGALGWLLGFAVFVPFYLLRGMGAGDVKLLAMLGAWLGPALVLRTALYGALAGGVLAIAVALAHGYLVQALRNVGYALWFWRTAGPRPVPALTLADATGPRLPYAVPIVTGMAAALWLR
jgi:prepilin peptidase CpaA